MRGLTTLVVMSSLFVMALLIGVPVLDKLVPIVNQMAPGYTSQTNAIRAAVVKWSVPVFLFTLVGWAVFWILRQERQTV